MATVVTLFQPFWDRMGEGEIAGGILGSSHLSTTGSLYYVLHLNVDKAIHGAVTQAFGETCSLMG